MKAKKINAPVTTVKSNLNTAIQKSIEEISCKINQLKQIKICN